MNLEKLNIIRLSKDEESLDKIISEVEDYADDDDLHWLMVPIIDPVLPLAELCLNSDKDPSQIWHEMEVAIEDLCEDWHLHDEHLIEELNEKLVEIEWALNEDLNEKRKTEQIKAQLLLISSLFVYARITKVVPSASWLDLRDRVIVIEGEYGIKFDEEATIRAVEEYIQNESSGVVVTQAGLGVSRKNETKLYPSEDLYNFLNKKQ